MIYVLTIFTPHLPFYILTLYDTNHCYYLVCMLIIYDFLQYHILLSLDYIGSRHFSIHTLVK